MNLMVIKNHLAMFMIYDSTLNPLHHDIRIHIFIYCTLGPTLRHLPENSEQKLFEGDHPTMRYALQRTVFG